MNDREKLIELLKNNVYLQPSSFVDYLLDNGVVFREKGHWIEGESFMLGENRKCSVCGGIFPCNSAWVMSYCPDCGAKMDGE